MRVWEYESMGVWEYGSMGVGASVQTLILSYSHTLILS